MNRYDSNKHHRRSVRRPGWDYRRPAHYFVTICTHQRLHKFDNSEFYDIAANALIRIPEQPHAQHTSLDTWVVMPNHVHLILIFNVCPFQADMSATAVGFTNALAGSLGVVVARYKAAVSTRINHLRRSRGYKVWQRGYYDRIIRNEREWQATRQYILDNPRRWAEDRDNLNALITKMTYHP
jgi:putative transposase